MKERKKNHNKQKKKTNEGEEKNEREKHTTKMIHDIILKNSVGPKI